MSAADERAPKTSITAGSAAGSTTAASNLWVGTSLVLLVGYFCMTRTFAYVGIPPWNVFVGEVVLGYFLLLGPRIAGKRWLSIATKTSSLKDFVRSFWWLFAYGVFEVARGIYVGRPPFTVARDLAFDYYPLYFFLGLWVGISSPRFLPHMIRVLAWFNAIYGILFILFLNNVAWTVPGVSSNVDPVPIFSGPTFSMIVLVGLLVFEKNLRSVWYLIMLNLLVLLGIELRGEWLGFAVALVVWGALSRRVKQILAIAIYLTILFLLLFLLNIKIQAPTGRGGGVISARDAVGRAVAPFDPNLSAEYIDNYQMAEGTALWRAIWWAQIWFSTNASPSRALLGYGYGFALGDLVPYLQGRFVRTPHNVLLYALGYTGWIGVGLFAIFQAAIIRMLYKVWKLTGQPFGLLFWTAVMTFALFEPCFETPYGAIPFYLVVGCACSPLLYARKTTSSVIGTPVIQGPISPLPHPTGSC